MSEILKWIEQEEAKIKAMRHWAEQDGSNKVHYEEGPYPAMEKMVIAMRVLVEACEWYRNWDWTDKYVQAIPKRAGQAIAKVEEILNGENNETKTQTKSTTKNQRRGCLMQGKGRQKRDS